jgi:hypothetical protein
MNIDTGTLSLTAWSIVNSIIVTHAYIFFSGNSTVLHNSASTHTRMLPYHSYCYESKASVLCLMPDYFPRRNARPVICYELFK